MKNKTIFIILICVTLIGCGKPRVLPIGKTVASTAPESTPDAQSKALGRSGLLTQGEIAQVIPKIMPESKRVLIANSGEREILIGYANTDDAPAALGSMVLVGDHKGDIVLTVGVSHQGGRTRIISAKTLKPTGSMYGMETYLHNDKRFLKQFAGHYVYTGESDIENVTGATPVCEAIRDVVSKEARELENYFQDPVRMTELVGNALLIWSQGDPSVEIVSPVIEDRLEPVTPSQRTSLMMIGAGLALAMVVASMVLAGIVAMPGVLRRLGILIMVLLILAMLTMMLRVILSGDDVSAQVRDAISSSRTTITSDTVADSDAVKPPQVSQTQSLQPVAADLKPNAALHRTVSAAEIGRFAEWKHPAIYVMTGLFVLAAYGYKRKMRILRYVTLAASVGSLGFVWGRLLSGKHISDFLSDITDVVTVILTDRHASILATDTSFWSQRVAWYLPLLIAVGGSLFVGRIWCGWICPLGAISGFMGWLTGRLTGRRVRLKIPLKVDRWLRAVKYALLLSVPVIVVATWQQKFWEFEPFQDVLRLKFLQSGFANWKLMWLAVLGVLFLLSGRFYCKYVCPVGAALGLVSRCGVSTHPQPAGCRSCSQCLLWCPVAAENTVPMELDPAECLRCGGCNECPKFGSDKAKKMSGAKRSDAPG